MGRTLRVERKPATRRSVELIVLVSVCAAVRIWLICNSSLIAKDGTIYVRMGREWCSDPAGVVRNYDYHVGYPAVMGGAHRLLLSLGWGDTLRTWELSGQLVSLIASLCGMAAVWAFAGMAFGWRIAWIAGLLFGIGRKWAVLGAEVLSDALSVSLQMWAVVLGIMVLERFRRKSLWSVAMAAAVGIFSGVGYLVRPEAVLPGALAAILWVVYQIRKKGSWGLTLGALGANAATTLTCMLPYVIAIGGLTKKKSITDFVTAPIAPGGVQTALPFLAAGHYGAIRHLLNQLFEALHPVVAVLVCLYLASHLVKRYATGRQRDVPISIPVPRWDALFMMLGGMGVMVPLLTALYANVDYLSYRHVMFTAMLLSPLSGAGMSVLIESATVLANRSALRNAPKYLIPGTIAIATLLGIGSHALRPMHAGKEHYRHAAQFVARSAKSGDRVITDSVWILHYSQVPGIQLGIRQLREVLRTSSPRDDGTYLILSEKTIRKGAPELQDALNEAHFAEIGRFVQNRSENPDSIGVYRSAQQ